MEYGEVEKLIKDLEPMFQFFSYYFNIPGMTKEDIIQELNLFVLETWRKKKVSDRGLGWWFKRCQWHLLNMVKKSERTPLDNSISIESFLEEQNDN